MSTFPPTSTGELAWPERIASLPCPQRCGSTLGEHRWSGSRGQLLCPTWRQRVGHRFARALAKVSKLVAGQ